MFPWKVTFSVRTRACHFQALSRRHNSAIRLFWLGHQLQQYLHAPCHDFWVPVNRRLWRNWSIRLVILLFYYFHFYRFFEKEKIWNLIWLLFYFFKTFLLALRALSLASASARCSLFASFSWRSLLRGHFSKFEIS